MPTSPTMTDGRSPVSSRRAKHIEEAVLDVDGVAGVRVWELPDRVEIGIVVAPSDPPNDVLKRVMEVVDALRDPEEAWDVGVLTDG